MDIVRTEGQRRLNVYTSLDPDQLFLSFDMPDSPRVSEIEMRVPGGLLWGKFECIQVDPSATK
jgi:hypothetical protein